MATPTLPNDYSSYPVFAADQVLTSDDLNNMFDYLDEQERLSRIYLVGMGIVCGFELTVDLSQYTISVSGGSGITSFGYLLFQGPASLSYYQKYTVPATVPTEDQYTPFTPGGGSTFYQLQSAAYVTSLSTTEQAKWTLLSSGGQALLNGMLVVLYLELSEDQMKSCLTGNCDGPGADMDLTVRYLLVSQADLYPGNTTVRLGAVLSADELPDLYLPRFSVPAGALPDFTSIYTAYSSLFDTTVSGNVITQLSGALQNLYTFLQPILAAYSTSPFLQVQTTLTNILAGVQKNKPYAIQYFYDFLDDLILAYREAQSVCADWTGTCTPDVGRFPLHLSLGSATQDTEGQVDDYRDYFIPSTLIARSPDTVEELRSLFDRINQMINAFVIPAYTVVNPGIGIIAPVRQTTVAIRVTPSSSGRAPLSQRAIPYYYPTKAAGPMQDIWNYALTRAGKPNENLSYNAGLYNVLPGGAPFVNPLLYDILPYDFFRIEGHIGQNYTTVLSSLTSQINTYRLPFGVIALKLGSDASDISPSTAAFGDLTSQYDVLRSSLLCNLGAQVCYYGGQNYTSAGQFTFLQNAGILQSTLTLGDINPVFKNLETVPGAVASAAFAATASAHADAPVTAPGTVSFLNLAQTGLVDSDVLKYTTLLPVNLRNIFQANIYARGQFLSGQPCFKVMSQTDQRTAKVGLTYMAKVNAGSSIPVNTPSEINSLSDYLLALLDMIDAVVADVFYVQLGYLNLSDFTTRYNTMTSYAASIVQLLNAQTNASLVPAGMVDYLTRLQASCNLGQLTALTQDYQTRYTALQQSLLFGNFVAANPAIDHRGGVPRGGTFLLVYYEKPPAVAATGAATLAGQLTANLNDTAALKNIIAGAATAKAAGAAAPRAATTASGAAAPRAVQFASAGSAARSLSTAAGATSTLSQLAALIQDKQYGFTAVQQSQLLGVLNQRASAAAPTTDASFSLTNNSVVADFFLPYLYNAQGGAITYVFPANPAPDPNPAPGAQFAVTPRQFVFNDPNTYHFTVAPALTQEDILQQTTDPTKLSNPDGLVLTATATDVTMVPQASNLSKTLTTTLQYESIAQTLTIVVPLADFSITLSQDATSVLAPGIKPLTAKVSKKGAPRMLQLTAADAGATAYTWTINGNTAIVPATANPSVDFDQLLGDLKQAALITIALTLTYTLNEVSASDTKTMSMKTAELETKLNSGPFQPTFNG
jgi:hypothetical protein